MPFYIEFLIDFYFRAVLSSQKNLAKGTEISFVLPCPHIMHSLPTIKILQQSGTFITINESTLPIITQNP